MVGRLVLAWLGIFALPDEVLAQRQDTTRNNGRNAPLRYTPSRRPTYRPNDRHGDPFSNSTTESPLFLKDPSRMKLDVEIDTSMNYTIYEKVGDLNYRPTSSMTFEEFKQYQDRQILKSYWQSRARAQDGESAVSSRNLNPKIYISPILDRIFGGSYVELIPRGFVTLDFGGSFQKINNPSIPIRQQRNGGFEFNQQINMSVVGKVGEKLQVTANFDNNNSFDFQNNMKVEYTGYKEDILQKLEIGNVSLPLNNTLIQGAQNLFGIKAQMQFGKLNVTSIATTQRGKTSSINVNGGGAGGGGQGRTFELIGSGYDENRHFFLGHFFRDNYESWVSATPQMISGVNITRVEVYILNRNNDTQTLRNVIGLMDLGEGRRIYNSAVTTNNLKPNANAANSLFAFVKGQNRSPDGIGDILESYFAGENNNGLDYEKITGARKLASTEYTYHPQLGYITLTRKLQNDEALAVAYQYTYNGKAYTVGELSEDYANLKDDEVIFLKMLRPRKIAIRDASKKIIPTWDLMMKNIYNLNVNQLVRDNFQLRIIYRDDRTGLDNPQLQESGYVGTRPLIELLGMDRLNPVNDPQPDGNFDYVEGITINSTTGLIIFPFLEPLGGHLRQLFASKDPSLSSYLSQKYAYDTLYHTTKADAELFATKNKFYIKGTYNAGSSKEILIPGFGVSQGSVKVFAGGIALSEGTDYVVDYTFGKVTILNESILNSGKNIEVKYEQNDPFAFQTRSLLGTRLDYRLSDDVNFGGTLLYYNERPIVSRNQIGTEPARNLQYGLDFNVNKKSRLLTKIVDALPFLQTKEVSTFNVTGEYAQLLPGTSNVVNGEGIAYIDDFESTATPYSLLNPTGWKLSSVPKSEDHRYDPSGGSTNDLSAGYRRAKMAWYTIDNQLQRNTGRFRPDNISDEDMQNHYVRGIGPQEIFPNKQLTQGVYFEQTLDIAYYPYERGPYNYKLNNSGLLDNPEQNWGAITSAIKTEVDFDKANIEYIEFWLLDPFLTGKNGQIVDGSFNKNNTTGGKLIFQLGSISEDVARDGKHAFENGLPVDGNLNNATANAWGYVTSQQYLTNGFDNTSNSSRANQDVGLDGLPSAKEADYFGANFSNLSGEVLQKVLSDPSGDDFRYFLDAQYDAVNAKVLQRYKDFNGMEGNTPISSNTSTVAAASYQNPDNEDLNADNTLSESEEYYEYSIDLRKSMLQVGKKYVVDEITTTRTNESKEPVTWYLFRIPVREFENQYGNIEGFKSIRYVRMLLTGFREPVVLRMANFRMVGSRWRRYTATLRESGLINSPEPNTDNFTVSVVNLEENSGQDPEAKKSPYVIPPGVLRDRDVTSAVSRQLNEQSVQMCVDDLEDGDARAIYKNVSADLFNYGRVKMFFHANSDDTSDDELYAFLRMGTDFDQNFYEIEIPLKISNARDGSQRGVWPEENEIDLALDELYALKAARDREGFALTELYPRSGPKEVGRHRLRMFGRPDLSSVQVLMIGVRNRKSDDKRRHSVCLWANELRVTDFHREAGWAVNSTVNTKLADFATVTGAFRHTTFGFGSINSKIAERTRETTTAYAVSANVNVDKLLPGNTGIKIPMFVGYENTTITPGYDPANPDMRLDAALKSFSSDDAKNQYLKLIQDRTTRRSLNFTNVRKTKVKADAPSHLWDIENFAFTYAYSEALRTNFSTAQALQRQYKGAVAYQFSPKATGIEPFKDAKGLSSPWLKVIKDFNFSLMPSSLGVRFDLDRSFTKNVYRTSLGAGQFSESTPNYLKYFTFNRQYNVRWNFSKNLSLEYNARANAIIDEPEGDIDTQEKKDSIMHNLKNFGRMKNFDQSVTVNYTLPLDKIPATDWVGADYRYQASYNWKAGAINIVDTLNFKNTIQNSREQNYSGRLDMVKLYNKIKFLKTLNTPPKPQRTPINPRTQQTRKPADSVKVREPAPIPGIVKGFFRVLMAVRSINGSYTITEGTILPGFTESPHLLGLDKNWGAPGWKFVTGSQDPNIRFDLAEQGLLVKNAYLTTPFSQSRTENLNLRANMELSPDMKIQLDVKKEMSATYQEIYRFDDDANGYQSLSPTRSGSYRVSTMSIKTAFNRSNSKVESDVFKTFEENLIAVRERFRVFNSEYDTTSQDVLIPAFIAAYTGKNASTINLSPFPKTPLPNWRVDYTGLSKLQAFKNVFQSVTISHAYQSTYSVSNYTNSLTFNNPKQLQLDRSIYDYNNAYFGNIDSETGNFTPVYVISQVLISEAFSPLVGINIRTKSRVTANLQYKTKRDLSLNISNAQITELTSKDVSLEVGFTKNNMKLPFKSQGRTVVLKNDVTFRMNMTVGDSRTIQRKIEEVNTITNGNINFQLRPNISYTVNQKLTVQMYFERNINEPLISSSARRATTRFGAQVRFSLAQ